MRHAPLLLLLLALASCGGRLAHQVQEAEKGEFALPPGTRVLQVQVEIGNVTVHPGPAGSVGFDASVRIAADTPELLAAVQRVGYRLGLRPGDAPGVAVLGLPAPPAGETVDPKAYLRMVRAVLRVPPDLEVVVRSGEGHLAAQGRTARVELQSGRGDLHLKECRADAVLQTRRGTVVVDGHAGALKVRSDDCSVQAMQLFVREVGAGGLDVYTSHGDIVAFLPENAAFEMDVVVPMGKGKNGFQIPITREDGVVLMQGKVHGGGPRVHLESRRGSISLGAERAAR
ncbi:MAG: hypothetical protein IT458_15960 [Planctomycetes bacterium]|nr:hypothetical protein [Planctomycetota bacterium]